MPPHEYEVTDDDGRVVVFVCPVAGCGRRVLLDRRGDRYTVIDRGDFFAQHVGGVGPIRIGLS